MFSGLIFLNRLSLSSNGISVVEDGAWQDLHQVKQLYLHANRITTLRAGIFKNLASLTELLLNSNGIQVIEYGAWEDLERLEILNLHLNKITILKTDIFYKLTSLQKLIISHNRIAVIESGSFEFSDSLSSLELVGNTFHFNSRSFQSILQPLGNTLNELSLNMGPYRNPYKWGFGKPQQHKRIGVERTKLSRARCVQTFTLLTEICTEPVSIKRIYFQNFKFPRFWRMSVTLWRNSVYFTMTLHLSMTTCLST